MIFYIAVLVLTFGYFWWKKKKLKVILPRSPYPIYRTENYAFIRKHAGKIWIQNFLLFFENLENLFFEFKY